MPDKFFVGVGSADLLIEDSHSLKDKRRIIKSLKEKLQNAFHLSVCECGDQSLWQRSRLGLAVCSNDLKIIHSTLNGINEYLESNPLITLLNFEIRVI
jgi:uncharacterized protein YlxP (DUF503 family)